MPEFQFAGDVKTETSSIVTNNTVLLPIEAAENNPVGQDPTNTVKAEDVITSHEMTVGESQAQPDDTEPENSNTPGEAAAQLYDSLSDLLYGEDIVVERIEKDESARSLAIYLRSRRDYVPCPACGQLCPRDGGGFERKLQDYPLIPTYNTNLIVHGRKCMCTNDACKENIFEEPLPFADKYARRTYRANIFTILVTIMLSFMSAMKVFRQLGFNIDHDTIRSIFHDARYICLADDPDVEEIGVDDVSNHKGMSYFTIIYRSRDHAPLALLQGRDGETLKKWLLLHPKVKKVMRDRASAYAKAIDEVCADGCIQIADRFHLIQNIIDHLKDVLKRCLPVAVAFKLLSDSDGTYEMLPNVPAKVARLETQLSVEEFTALQYDNSPFVDEDGNIVVINARLSDPESKQSKKNEQSRMAKHKLICDVREAYANLDIASLNLRKNASKAAIIASRFGLSAITVSKYVRMSEEEVEAVKDVRPTKDRITGFDDYKNMAYKMLRDNIDIQTIALYIRNQGCTLADLTIILHIEAIQRHHFPERPIKSFSSFRQEAQFPEGVKVFSRSAIMRQIFTVHDEEKDKELAAFMPAIMERYPILAEASTIYGSFHSAIMGNDTKAIDRWIAENQEGMLSSFVDSVAHDIVPIKNAIIYPESSGFVEGNNNKFKTIKRLLYGRSGRANLEIRFIIACLFTKADFKLGDICPFYDPSRLSA